MPSSMNKNASNFHFESHRVCKNGLVQSPKYFIHFLFCRLCITVQVLVQVENRRRVLTVSSGEVEDFKKTVISEFGEILWPASQSALSFQKWDEDFQEYLDLDGR